MAANELESLISLAVDHGWRVKRLTSGHRQLLAPDGVSIVTAPSTPSDHRGILNMRSELRKAGLEVPHRQEKPKTPAPTLELVPPSPTPTSAPQALNEALSAAPEDVAIARLDEQARRQRTRDNAKALTESPKVSTVRRSISPLGAAMATKTKSAAEQIAELQKQIAQLEKAAKAEEAVDAAEGLAASLKAGQASSVGASQLATIFSALEPGTIVAALRQAGIVTSGRASGTAKASGGGAPFDEGKLLAYLKGQDKVTMRQINSALGTKSKASDLSGLIESGKVVQSGKAPQFYYQLA